MCVCVCLLIPDSRLPDLNLPSSCEQKSLKKRHTNEVNKQAAVHFTVKTHNKFNLGGGAHKDFTSTHYNLFATETIDSLISTRDGV